MDVEVGRGAISGTISVSSYASSRTRVLSNPDLSGKYLCAFRRLISKEVEVFLKFSDEALIPTALFLYCCNHSSSLNLCSATSLISLFSVERAESLVGSSTEIFLFPFLL